MRRVLLRFAPLSSALLRSAPASLTPLSLTQVRSAPPRSAPFKFTDVALARIKYAARKSALQVSPAQVGSNEVLFSSPDNSPQGAEVVASDQGRGFSGGRPLRRSIGSPAPSGGIRETCYPPGLLQWWALRKHRFRTQTFPEKNESSVKVNAGL